MENIHKIWGDRKRIHLDDKNEIENGESKS